MKCLQPGSRLCICEIALDLRLTVAPPTHTMLHPHNAPPTHTSSGNWVCGWSIHIIHRSLFFPSHTERRARLDYLTSPARGYTNIEHTDSSEHEASPSMSLVTQSLPSNAATRDILLKSLMADPETRTKMVAMLREDLNVGRSSSYNALGGNPSRLRTQTDLETSPKWLSLEGRSHSLGTIGVGSIPPQPCTTTLQRSDDPCQPNTTFSQISDDSPSQASDDPIESRAAIHQTPTDPSTADVTFSPLSSECQPRKETRESSSSQASSSSGVGSPAPLQSNSASKQHPCTSPMTLQQQCEGKLTGVAI